MATTRVDRELQLQLMLRTEGGQHKIVETYHAAYCTPGEVGPVGMLLSDMISKILDYEFPPSTAPQG